MADPALARRFIDAYMGFLGTLVSDEEISTQTSTSAWLVIGRQRYVQAPETLSAYRAQNPGADAEILSAIEGTASAAVGLSERHEPLFGLA